MGCAECSREVKGTLEDHAAYYHSPNFCRICVTNYGKLFDEHMYDIHGIADYSPFFCLSCSKDFGNDRAYRQHMKIGIHDGVARENYCRICSKQLPDEKAYRDHNWKAHWQNLDLPI